MYKFKIGQRVQFEAGDITEDGRLVAGVLIGHGITCQNGALPMANDTVEQMYLVLLDPKHRGYITNASGAGMFVATLVVHADSLAPEEA